MVEQNKSPPVIREPKRYKESWMDDPSKALRVQGLLAGTIVGIGILVGEGWLLPKERQKEQAAANSFLQHSEQADTVTKADFRLLETELTETIKQMLATNAERPKQRPVPKKTGNSPK